MTLNYIFAQMKYERLSKNELEELEKEFVDFLVVNGITAQDWVVIKENEPLNADEIINQFSDVVWESILRSTKYLNKVEADKAYYFKCDADKIHLKRVYQDQDKAVQEIATKAYNGVREQELFQMIVSGCMISEGEEYEALG